MSDIIEMSNPSSTIDASVSINPLIVPNAQITTIKFEGTNYLAKSQSIIYISGKDKEYILKDMPIPSLKDPKYKK